MRRAAETKRTLASQAWRMIAEYTMTQFGRSASLLAEWGLTPGHMKVLVQLEPGIPRAMGHIAQGMPCDASTATWLIDRLEERGMVERRASPTDRRVKAVVLTPEGIKAKATIEKRLFEPPDDILSLDRAALETLRDVVTRIRGAQLHASSGGAAKES